MIEIIRYSWYRYQLNREQKEILYNSYFSNFLTAVKAMADFRIDKEFMRNFVEKNKENIWYHRNKLKIFV